MAKFIQLRNGSDILYPKIELRTYDYTSNISTQMTNLFKTRQVTAYRIGRIVILYFNFGQRTNESIATRQFYNILSVAPEFWPTSDASYIIPTQGANSSGVLVIVRKDTGLVQLYFEVPPAGFFRGSIIYMSLDN